MPGASQGIYVRVWVSLKQKPKRHQTKKQLVSLSNFDLL